VAASEIPSKKLHLDAGGQSRGKNERVRGDLGKLPEDRNSGGVDED
jgi:hypothetical protein